MRCIMAHIPAVCFNTHCYGNAVALGADVWWVERSRNTLCCRRIFHL